MFPVERKAGIDEKLCIGCGICPNRCPFGAITITNIPEEQGSPIHRYGRNGFHLYGLPTPLFGKVVGVIGKNGIGKSTAIKIIAGQLAPNLGEDAPSKHKLLERFKGTEAQQIFERIAAGALTVSYKPQQVDLIPTIASGTVADLLRKADERGLLQSIAEKLDLINVLERDIKAISGGELQRVAIAAAVLKKADVYIFDEPTTYLDIAQRLKLSSFIRSLADEKTAVMVVEHDLIVLDAMADLVHIIYGKEGAYGIVSHPKTGRTGINTYLDGYIRDENMRFRDTAITFTSRPPSKKQKPATLTAWTHMQKALDTFKLEIGPGTIFRDEVVGVVGENGIGKTSFVKILAHILPPDAGSVESKIRVAYKPQYLDSSSDELVASVLHTALSTGETLLRPLDLQPLLLKQLNQLSGGELQRVAIAHCLGQDADVYLLDEPSAYMDIEQRLILSKVVRDIAQQRGRTIIVVDHDLLFLDYISDRLLVFDGVPSLHGLSHGPFSMEEGMDKFLRKVDLTFRRDPETNRPRANKQGSQMDREQKETSKRYYS